MNQTEPSIVSEDIQVFSAIPIPVFASVDSGYGMEEYVSNSDSTFLTLPEVESRFTSDTQEFVAFADLESMDPPCYTVPIPQDAWSTFGRGMSLGEFAANDVKMTLYTVDDDFLAFWKPRNVAFLGTGLGLAIGLRQSVDQDTRGYVNRHPKRWGSFTETLGVLGNTEYQIASIVLLYGYSFHTQNSELMDLTQVLIRSYTLTGLSTVAVKAIANTDRPSAQWMNGQFGFPSAHASTSFAIAATLEEYYGPRVGIPAYVLAGLIGWSRIDEQDHDVSDVVFGAFLGYAIAKSVAGRHLRGDSRIQFFPWTDPNRGTYGAMFEVDY